LAPGAYAAGETLRSHECAKYGFDSGPSFFVTAAASVAIAASITLIPHAPLLETAILVNVAATLLMPPALILLLLLANDNGDGNRCGARCDAWRNFRLQLFAG